MSAVLAFSTVATPATSPVVHVVDVDTSLGEFVARLLRAGGHDVATYPSADAFIELGHQECGCILLDARKAGPDGLMLQRLLAERGNTLPVVVLTGCSDVSLSVQAMKNGAYDVLPEPVPKERLLDAIRLALEKDACGALQRARFRELCARYDSLTLAERHVFAKVASGMLNKQIAFDLGRSERTVKAHRAQTMLKMRANSVADLVRMADQLGVAGPDQQTT